MLRFLRKNTKVKIKEIATEIEVHEKTIFKMEKNFKENMYVKYLKWLRKNGADLNKFFDENQ